MTTLKIILSERSINLMQTNTPNHNSNSSNQEKEELRSMLGEYLTSKNIDVNKNFTCLNPYHEDNTPSMSYNKIDNYVHCFGCGVTYDIFDLYAMDNMNVTIDASGNPMLTGYNFKEAYNKVAALYGMNVKKLKTTPEDALQSKIDAIIRRQVENSKENIQGGAEYLKNRGITLETAKKYGLGYIEKWINPTVALKENRNLTPTSRIIIPTSSTSYLARYTKSSTPTGVIAKEKQGKVHLFNGKALFDDSKPTFIVEGEFDALSILQVTDKAEAVGIGGTGNIRAVKETITYIRNQKREKNEDYDPTLLLALDNDDAGRNASRKLEIMLDNIGVTYYVVNISLGYKDANEALVANQGKFATTIESRIKDPEDYLTTYLNDTQRLHDHPNIIPTGFRNIDDVLNGGLNPMLYVIGAVSSLGKSTFILQIADRLAMNGHPVLFYELEMTKRELTNKILSRLTLEINKSVPNSRPQTAHSMNIGAWLDNSANMKLVNDAIGKYGEYYSHLHIYDSMLDRPTAKNIYDRVALYKRKHPDQHPLVVVDYLQILQSIDSRATDKAQVTDSITWLKKIVSTFNLPVIVISSLNRSSYSRPISMEAYKESGEIEYYADVLLGLQYQILSDKDSNESVTGKEIAEAKAKSPREIELKVLKNRGGMSGVSVNLLYNPMFNYFMESSKQPK